MKEKLREQKLFFISILFMILFSFPFAKMMNGPGFIAGIPQLYFYITLLWFLSIVITWLLADTRRKKTRPKKNE